MFGLHRLLWEIRNRPAVAAEYAADPAGVLDRYALTPQQRAAFEARDFKTLYDMGTNPYLLYFCALQLGVDRAAYYADVRGGPAEETAHG